MEKSDKSLVGDLINFRGLVYSPLNENGVVFLFGKVAEDLNMYVEEIKPGFPDCIARRFTGKGWERIRVEFEYTSSNFKQHGHDPNDCDTIICWEHDWNNCPIEVIELKDRIKEMENWPIARPDAVVVDNDIDKWFDNYQVQETPRKIFKQLGDYLKLVDAESFFRVGKTTVSIYCPERVFIYLYPRKKLLRIDMFTGGKSLGKARQYDFQSGGVKWGGLSISNEAELKEALPWIKESYDRIKMAIKNNEPTGWFAKVDEVDNET
ncbi:MAG: hypothetical protein NTX52_13350 [Planctomycetota bacterium]|nr:hypothetical protein [Planctomycetota bacterium]